MPTMRQILFTFLLVSVAQGLAYAQAPHSGWDEAQKYMTQVRESARSGRVDFKLGDLSSYGGYAYGRDYAERAVYLLTSYYNTVLATLPAGERATVRTDVLEQFNPEELVKTFAIWETGIGGETREYLNLAMLHALIQFCQDVSLQKNKDTDIEGPPFVKQLMQAASSIYDSGTDLAQFGIERQKPAMIEAAIWKFKMIGPYKDSKRWVQTLQEGLGKMPTESLIPKNSPQEWRFTTYDLDALMMECTKQGFQSSRVPSKDYNRLSRTEAFFRALTEAAGYGPYAIGSDHRKMGGLDDKENEERAIKQIQDSWENWNRREGGIAGKDKLQYAIRYVHELDELSFNSWDRLPDLANFRKTLGEIYDSAETNHQEGLGRRSLGLLNVSRLQFDLISPFRDSSDLIAAIRNEIENLAQDDHGITAKAASVPATEPIVQRPSRQTAETIESRNHEQWLWIVGALAAFVTVTLATTRVRAGRITLKDFARNGAYVLGVVSVAVWRILEFAISSSAEADSTKRSPHRSSEKETSILIASAVERGSSVHVYDERGRTLCLIARGSGPTDGLKGYTSTTVSVRRGSSILIHNARGQVISSTPAE